MIGECRKGLRRLNGRHRRVAAAAVAICMYGMLAGCAYSVSGPDDPESLPAVAADPNLAVTGLDVFLQDIQPETFACAGVNVRIDYGDEVMRRTQVAWQNFRRNEGATSGSVAFESLDVEMDCRNYTWGGSYARLDCRTQMELTTTFQYDDMPPVTESVYHSVTSSPSSYCEGTKKSAQGAMSHVLGETLLTLFNDYGIAP